MEIRRLVPEDAADFARIRLLGLHESPKAFGSSPEEDLAVDADRVEKKILADTDSPLFGVLTPDLVAVAGLHRNHHRKARHRATIWGVYVLPEHRGQGLARALLLSVMRYAVEKTDIERVDLCVVAENRAALRLYEGLGFEVWGHEVEAMIVDGCYLDEYHLSQRLQRDQAR